MRRGRVSSLARRNSLSLLPKTLLLLKGDMATWEILLPLKAMVKASIVVL